MNNIERHTLELIGEDTDNPDVFTDDDTGLEPIRDSINDAIAEIAMLTGTATERYFLPLRADRQFYRMELSNGSIGWITDVWILALKRRLEQTDVIRLNHHNPRWLMNSGTPQAYFPIGFKWIGVWPRPASDSDLLEIRCVLIPGAYETDADRIKLRSSFEWAAAHFSAGEYFAGRGDAKRALFHHQQYLGRLGVHSMYPFTNAYQPKAQTEKEPYPKATD